MKKLFYLFVLMSILNSNYAAEIEFKKNYNIQIKSMREYIQQFESECFSKLDKNQKFLVAKLIFFKIENEFLEEKNREIFAVIWKEAKFNPDFTSLVYNYLVRIFYNNVQDVQKEFAIALQFYKFVYGKIEKNEELIKPTELEERFKKVSRE